MQDLKQRIEAALALLRPYAKDYPLDIKPVVNVIKELTEREDKLIAAIKKTLNDNLHLADGDNCTLITLKLVLRELGIDSSTTQEG